MISADNLVKTFTRIEKKNKKVEFNAVDGISFEAKEGEIVGILGPNGAGKTTLLRMLVKLMKPSSGNVSVSIGENTISDDIEIKKHIGYLSGNTKLYGKLSPRELLMMLGTIYGMDEETTRIRAEEIMKVLSMEAFFDNRIEKLSTGQTQRTSIARCLIHSPEIYVFDEPTLGLDIISSAAIIEFMKQEREKGKTVIYSTHYMEEAEYLCDRIILVNKGKIVANGTLAELKEKSAMESLRDIFNELIRKETYDEE